MVESHRGQLEGKLAFLAGTNSNSVTQIDDEELSISNLPCPGDPLQHFHDGLQLIITTRNVEFEFGNEVHDVLCPSENLSVTSLSAKSAYLGYRDSSNISFCELVLHFF